MSIEDRLQDALGPALGWQEPSPDLFARVQRSVEDDRRRRLRLRLGGAAAVGLLVAAAALIVAVGEVRAGRFLVEWWWVEGLVTAGLAALVAVLGPLVRRFGRIYVSDVFRATPGTGAALLRLLDIAYYLVFGAYVVVTASVARRPSWTVLAGAEQLWHEAARTGGLLLLMGVLHGLNLLLLPVVARLLALDRMERSPDPPG